MFDGLEDSGAGSSERREAPAVAREIVSQGRIEFDEDGELVGFEETRWRRDAGGGGSTRLLPLTPCKADGVDEPGDDAGDKSGATPADLVGSLDTFEKHRPRDWLGFMVPAADEQRYTAEERYRQRSAPLLEASRVAWMCWLDRRAESLDDLRTPRVDASAARDSPVLLERHGWRHSEEVRELVRGGVPHELRARIWPLLCGSSESVRREVEASSPLSWDGVQARLAEVGTSYEQLHELGEGTVEQIEKDVPRTFSRNDAFKQEATQHRLFQILLGYALRSTSSGIGYSQSMNYIAGLLLLVTGRQDATFRLLCTLVEQVLPDGLYSSSGITAAQVETSVFVSLVADSRAFKCKGGGAALLDHMSCLGCPVDSLVVQWFSCLFANTLPWSVVLRIWDLLLLPVANDDAPDGARRVFRGSGASGPAGGGGGSAVLHRAALAILLRLEVEARACVAIEQIFALFSSGVLAMHDEHEFVSLILNDKALMVGGGGRMLSRGGSGLTIAVGGGGAASLATELSPAGLEERRQIALQAFAPTPADGKLPPPPTSSSVMSLQIDPIPSLRPDPSSQQDPQPDPQQQPQSDHGKVHLSPTSDPVTAPRIDAQQPGAADLFNPRQPPHDDQSVETRQAPPVSGIVPGAPGGPRSKEELRASVDGLSEPERSTALISILDAAAASGDDVLLGVVMELLNEGVAHGTD